MPLTLPALRQFSKLQMGIEATKGTAVAATRVLVGERNGYREIVDTYRSDYPVGIRGTVGGAGVIVRQGTDIVVNTDLTPHEILWPLELGIRGGISPATVDTNARNYVYTPELTTALPTIKTATGEIIESDGTTNWIASQVAHLMCSGFKITWSPGQPAKLSYTLFGRHRQTLTPTGALTVYSSREVLVSPLLEAYFDTSWANLGNTQLTTAIRSLELDVDTGFAPDYTIGDALADLDFTQYQVGPLKAKLKGVLELNTAGSARFTKARANSVEYIRLLNTGSLIGAVSARNQVRVDGAYRHLAPPVISDQGDVKVCAIDMEAVYDDTGTKEIEFSAQSLLTAIT